MYKRASINVWSDNKWISCFVKRKQPSLPVLSGTRDPVIYRCCTLHTLCTVHCTLYTVHCTLCTVHCTLYVHPLYVGCMLSGYCPLAVGCRGTSCTVYHLLYILCPICITVQLFMLCLTVKPARTEWDQRRVELPRPQARQKVHEQLCQVPQLVLPRLVAKQKLPGQHAGQHTGQHTVSPKPYLRADL